VRDAHDPAALPPHGKTPATKPQRIVNNTG